MSTLNSDSILLVHPLGYQSESAGRDISRVANIMPPIGLASIAAYLEKNRISASIIDCYAHPDSIQRIKSFLLAKKPAWIGMSCTTSTFLDGVRICSMAKSLLPEIKTVFGGVHVSALKELILRDFEEVDYCIVGEGEEALLQLIQSGQDSPETIEGLVFRENNSGVRFTGYRRKLIELDDLPFPAYEKLSGYPQTYTLPIFNYPTAPNSSCISSRGCPYACSYCDRSVFRRSFRYNSATYLYEHLRYLQKRFQVRHINFYDDQFTFNRQRVEDFCSLALDNGLNMTFNCAVRAEHIDADLLKMMKAAGCWMISLGIETGDEDLLAHHRQNVNLKMMDETVHMIKDAGIRVKGLLMMGLPGETEQSIRKSMDYVFSLPLDEFNLAKFTPFPGSPLYANIHNLGTFEENWEKMDCMDFVFIPHGMTKKKLDRLYVNFYRSHFKRPRTLLAYLSMIWKSPDSWLRFLRNLGSFLSFAKSSKRISTSPSQKENR